MPSLLLDNALRPHLSASSSRISMCEGKYGKLVGRECREKTSAKGQMDQFDGTIISDISAGLPKKCVVAIVLGQSSPRSINSFSVATNRAIPSWLSVPFPNSSKSISEVFRRLRKLEHRRREVYDRRCDFSDKICKFVKMTEFTVIF